MLWELIHLIIFNFHLVQKVKKLNIYKFYFMISIILIYFHQPQDSIIITLHIMINNFHYK